MRDSLNDETTTISFPERDRRFRLVLYQYFMRAAARRAKFGTNRLQTLTDPRKERNFVCIVGCSSFATALVVCFASFRRPFRVAGPIY